VNLEDYNNEKYVAHYTTLNTVVEHIVPTNKLKISSSIHTNDPYENTFDWIESYSLGHNLVFNEQLDTLNLLRQKIYNLIKIFCTTSYDKSSTHSNDFSNHIYGKPRMWAQYGDNHKGVCLIFDKNELQEQFETIDRIALFAKHIEYFDDLSIINNTIDIDSSQLEILLRNPDRIFDILNNNHQLYHKFFRKHLDWKSENEYRWLLFSRTPNELYLDFYKSLKAIVFGSKVPDRYFSSLKYDNIPLYCLDYRNNNYQSIKL